MKMSGVEVSNARNLKINHGIERDSALEDWIIFVGQNWQEQ